MVQDRAPPSNGRAGVITDQERRNNVAAHVLMIPYPTQPHIVPMLDLAHQLASCGDIIVTFVSFQVLIDRLLKDRPSKKEAKNGAVRLIGVPDDRPDFNPPSELVTNPEVLRESLQLGHNLEPYVEKLLQDRKSSDIQGPTCLVVDIIHWWSTDVASKLSIPRYVLPVLSTGYFLTLMSWHVNGAKERTRGVKYIHLPGFPPDLIRSSKDFPLIAQGDVLGEQIRNRWPKSTIESDGVLLNTWLALDAKVVDSLRNLLPANMPLMAVGPLGLSPALLSTNVSMEGLELSDEASVTNWLDQQPPTSVLYVCFGTTGLNDLTKRHVLELAGALEASQQRFLWVMRAPPDVYDISETLPDGFEERVKGRALLLTGWAPQKKILAHPSTGGFLSSCGWNSTVESLTRGVPIIGWPSFADQPTICRFMAVIVKVAIELPRQEDHFVHAEEIKKAIRVVLQSEEGKAMRERARKCKISLAEALAPGGSSYRAVQEFADLIRDRAASS